MSSTIQVSLLPADVLDVLARSQDDNAPARKKTFHGRKLPVDHIPRPRNAFILFRTNFVEESKLTRGTEADHRNISKIAGAVWRALPPEEKLQWHQKALEEKEMHKRKYPNYKYTPVLRREGVNRRKVKQKLWEGIDDDNEDEEMALAPTSGPSTSAPLPPANVPTSFTLQGLESFDPQEDESGPSSSLPMLTASTDVSPPPSEALATPYDTSVSSPLNNTSSSPPPQTKGPRDRCDVIAELYAKGWRGEQLEAEVRRREEEGRKRRGGYEGEGGVDSKPATIVMRSRATIREERKADNDLSQGREVKPKPPPKRARKRTRKSSSSEAAARDAPQHYASTSTSPFTTSTSFPPVHRIVDEDYDRPLEPEVNYDIFQDVPIDIFASSSGLLPEPHHPALAAKVYEDAGERYRKRWAAQTKSTVSSGTGAGAGRMSRKGAQLDVSGSENVRTSGSTGLHAGGSPFDSPIPHVPLSLPHSPHLPIQPDPLTVPFPSGPAGDHLFDLLQAVPTLRGDEDQFGRSAVNRWHSQSHLGSGSGDKGEKQQEPRWAGWLRGEMISLATGQEASKRRGHGRKMSISQPSSPSQLNQAYVELGVESVYPPRHLETWAGLTAYLQAQQFDGWLSSGPTQHHPPAKPPSPSSRSAPDASTRSTPPSYQRDDFLAHTPAPQLPSAIPHVPSPPVTASASAQAQGAPVQERSKWDEACRRWEARGGPLALGAGVITTLCPATRRADRVNRKVVKTRMFDRTNEEVGMVTDKSSVVPRYDASYRGGGREEVMHPPASEPDSEYHQQGQSHNPPPFVSTNGTDAFANYEPLSGGEDCLPQTQQPNQDLQWSPETGCYSASFTPTDIGVQYTSSPYEYGFGQQQHHQQAAESWTSGSTEDLRYALVPVMMKLEADADNLSPEQLMLLTPSQASESFGHSSQPIESAGMNTVATTAAADFGRGHEVGLGLIYAGQSPSGSSL